jgi:hypothetical protein
MNLVDATIETVDSMDGEATAATILKPSTIRIYGRLLEPKEDEGQLQPQLELALHAGDFQFTIDESQYVSLPLVVCCNDRRSMIERESHCW